MVNEKLTKILIILFSILLLILTLIYGYYTFLKNTGQSFSEGIRDLSLSFPGRKVILPPSGPFESANPIFQGEQIDSVERLILSNGQTIFVLKGTFVGENFIIADDPNQRQIPVSISSNLSANVRQGQLSEVQINFPKIITESMMPLFKALDSSLTNDWNYFDGVILKPTSITVIEP